MNYPLYDISNYHEKFTHKLLRLFYRLFVKGGEYTLLVKEKAESRRVVQKEGEGTK